MPFSINVSLRYLTTFAVIVLMAFAPEGSRGFFVSLPLIAVLYWVVVQFSAEESGWREAPVTALRWVTLGLSAAAFAILGFSLVAIFRPITLNFDEGYYLNAAMGFVEFGTTHIRMWDLPEPNRLIIGGGFGHGAWLYFWFMKFAGVTLEAARLFSWSWGVVSVLLCFLYTRTLFGKDAAFFSTALYLCTFGFLLTISARLDTLSFCAYFLSLIALERWRGSPSALLQFGAGLILFLAMEFHGLSAVYAAAGVASVLFFQRWPIAFLAGAITGALFEVAERVLYQGEVFFAAIGGCLYCKLSLIEREWLRISDFVTLYPLETFLLILVVFWAASYQGGDRAVVRRELVKVSVGYLAFFFVGPPHHEYHLLPLWIPLLGFSLSQILMQTPGESGGISQLFYRRPIILCCLVVMALKTTTTSFTMAYEEQPARFGEDMVSCIRSIVPDRSDVIAGPPPLYAQLPEYRNYIQAGQGLAIGAQLQGVTPVELLSRREPKVVILPPIGRDAVSEELLESRKQRGESVGCVLNNVANRVLEEELSP